MANKEKNVDQAKQPAPKKAKNPNLFIRAGARIARWFREMISELKKVVWPSRKIVTQKTVVALVVIAAAAMLVGGFDWVAALAYKALLRLSALFS